MKYWYIKNYIEQGNTWNPNKYYYQTTVQQYIDQKQLIIKNLYINYKNRKICESKLLPFPRHIRNKIYLFLKKTRILKKIKLYREDYAFLSPLRNPPINVRKISPSPWLQCDIVPDTSREPLQLFYY